MTEIVLKTRDLSIGYGKKVLNNAINATLEKATLQLL